MSHPLLLSFLFFVASALFSLLAPEIRAALKRGGLGMTRISLGIAQDRLKRINNMHENVYQLLLWLAEQISHVMLETLVVLFVWFFVILLPAGAKRTTELRAIFGGFLLGSWFSTLLQVVRMLWYLRTPTHSRAKLLERIARLELKVATQHQTASLQG